jgi:hypothetical protein
VVHEQLAVSFADLFGAKSHDQAVLLAEKLKEILPAPTSKSSSFLPDPRPTIRT